MSANDVLFDLASPTLLLTPTPSPREAFSHSFDMWRSGPTQLGLRSPARPCRRSQPAPRSRISASTTTPPQPRRLRMVPMITSKTDYRCAHQRLRGDKFGHARASVTDNRCGTWSRRAPDVFAEAQAYPNSEQ
ncbi:hypothetical protein K438DRAFT_1955202 [Mycena galopus ATCC 62051]|nr:hypothetical protein K438DRAFT_1955202 [Mycena galopus ATCC 62051]